MGHTTHHAIIVTSFRIEYIQDAKEKAEKLGMMPSPPIGSPVNAWWSMLIPPDGSKNGWAESDKGDRCRTEFCEWIRSQRDEDGGSMYEWVEVQYGNDDYCIGSNPALVVAHEWDDDPRRKATGDGK